MSVWSYAVREVWLTKQELSHELKVSVRTIERLRLPHMRVGNQNRYLFSEVRAALTEPSDYPDNVVPAGFTSSRFRPAPYSPTRRTDERVAFPVQRVPRLPYSARA